MNERELELTWRTYLIRNGLEPLREAGADSVQASLAAPSRDADRPMAAIRFFSAEHHIVSGRLRAPLRRNVRGVVSREAKRAFKSQKVRVRILRYEEGSIEIWVAIGIGVGAGYKFVTEYDKFRMGLLMIVDDLPLLAKRVKQIMGRYASTKVADGRRRLR